MYLPRTKLQQQPIWSGTVRFSAICHFYGDCNYTKHGRNVQGKFNFFMEKILRQVSEVRGQGSEKKLKIKIQKAKLQFKNQKYGKIMVKMWSKMTKNVQKDTEKAQK